MSGVTVYSIQEGVKIHVFLQITVRNSGTLLINKHNQTLFKYFPLSRGITPCFIMLRITKTSPSNLCYHGVTIFLWLA